MYYAALYISNPIFNRDEGYYLHIGLVVYCVHTIYGFKEMDLSL